MASDHENAAITEDYKKSVTRKIVFRFLGFYLILIGIAFWLLSSTWFVHGWVKLCQAAKLSLADFNSIFELSTAFYFAYHVIVAFRAGLKERIYTSVDKRLQISVQKLTIAFFNEQDGKKLAINIYKSDLQEKWAMEKEERDNNDKHRIESSFFHFAFFCLIVIICGAFLEAEINLVLKMRIYAFLLFFSIFSIAITEYNYRHVKRPHFEWTLINFILLVLMSWPIAVYTSNTFFESSNAEQLNQYSQLSINGIILFVVLTHFWPFFLFFRKMYFFALSYTAISYVIAAEVQVGNMLEKPFGWIGEKLFYIGQFGQRFFGQVGDVGKGMKDRTDRRKNGKNDDLSPDHSQEGLK